MHIIFDHVYEYLEKRKDLNGGKWTGLGIDTTQPFEAVHHDFMMRWNHYKVSCENGAYKNSFHRAVCCYNSLNIGGKVDIGSVSLYSSSHVNFYKSDEN